MHSHCTLGRRAHGYIGELKQESLRQLHQALSAANLPSAELALFSHEARLRLFDYIDGFYHRTRLHTGLGYQFPLAFERNLGDTNN